MVSLLCAAVFFLAIHLLVSGTPLRNTIVQRVGEQGFQGIFSLASIAGLVWLCMAYGRAPRIELWGTADVLRPLALGVMAVAILLGVVGLVTPSPTATGGEGRLDLTEPATGILRVTRHPFLWGVSLWAVMHLVLNGDAASLVLFGSLLGLAVVGPWSIDAKRARRFGARWESFAAATSNVPFMAIAQGRNRLRLAEIGWWRVTAATAVYAGLLYGHAWLFGVSPFPR
jgi:uncharacterized membrane protein